MHFLPCPIFSCLGLLPRLVCSWRDSWVYGGCDWCHGLLGLCLRGPVLPSLLWIDVDNLIMLKINCWTFKQSMHIMRRSLIIVDYFEKEILSGQHYFLLHKLFIVVIHSNILYLWKYNYHYKAKWMWASLNHYNIRA